MTYCKDYCEERGISTSKLTEAQKALYYVAENMKMEKSISEEGYKYFQMAIKALEQESVLDKVRAEVMALRNIRAEEFDIDSDVFDDRVILRSGVLDIIDRYRVESEG